MGDKDVTELFLDETAILRMRKDVQIIVENGGHHASCNLLRIYSGADHRGVACRPSGRFDSPFAIARRTISCGLCRPRTYKTRQ